MKTNRNSNKVLALASALVALGAGYSFNFWTATEAIAHAQHVNAKEIWDMACFKANIKHNGTNPDTPPTTPAPAMPAPDVKKPNVVKLARVSYTRRLTSLGTRDEHTWCNVRKKVA